ncbi:undecaprenyl-diphosphatase [Anaeromusa acidaminophila]|uniref:undecaprenyl-diphosphatase n=1 Tax=Anaeromusa acidaminophila TaxID=81464 RepID=UPI000373DF25|nr:undecaprenyl-diphosphatase [Anaeromusa acidaminophila]
MNLYFFEIINGLAYKSVLMDKMMIGISNYLPYVFMATLVCMYLYGFYKESKILRRTAIDIVTMTIIDMLLSFVIGYIYPEARPFVGHNVNQLIQHVPNSSFPSNHALGTMAIALGLIAPYRTCGIVFACLAIVVGISRVYVGVHYPIDILGGFALALLINACYRNLWQHKVRKAYFYFEEYIVSFVRSCQYRKGKL